MKFGSVCSGIEAASVAWSPLGWSASWFSEIEKSPCLILAHHYPEIQNLGDMNGVAEQVKKGMIDAPDILVGGTPCQAFSVAGLRNSLDDDRGQLSLEFVRLANEIDAIRLSNGLKPSVIVWENVRGVLNTRDNAFGCFLGALSGSGCELQPTGGKWSNSGCVFGPQRQVAWRLLDAQYFGIPQRRKRIFVVASAREECVADVLFERKSMSGDINSIRKEGENTAIPSQRNIRKSESAVEIKDSFCIQGNIIGRSENSGANGLGIKLEQAYTLTRTDLHGVAYSMIADTTPKISKEVNCTLRSSGGGGIVPSSVAYQSIARYLTEIECERLQGFPDNYTNVDGISKRSRYMALGNSMAVPVMAWIGERIKKVYGGEYEHH